MMRPVEPLRRRGSVQMLVIASARVHFLGGTRLHAPAVVGRVEPRAGQSLRLLIGSVSAWLFAKIWGYHHDVEGIFTRIIDVGFRYGVLDIDKHHADLVRNNDTPGRLQIVLNCRLGRLSEKIDPHLRVFIDRLEEVVE